MGIQNTMTTDVSQHTILTRLNFCSASTKGVQGVDSSSIYRRYEVKYLGLVSSKLAFRRPQPKRKKRITLETNLTTILRQFWQYHAISTTLNIFRDKTYLIWGNLWALRWWFPRCVGSTASKGGQVTQDSVESNLTSIRVEDDRDFLRFISHYQFACFLSWNLRRKRKSQLISKQKQIQEEIAL